MSVEYIKGDLLDFPDGINVIAHCCNCQNNFGAGIAKTIKDRYPLAFEVDTNAHAEFENVIGAFSYADIGAGKKVVNLYGQNNYGKDRRHLDYEGLYTALESIKTLLENAHREGRQYVLGVPYHMGCDRAGGSWTVVGAMLFDLFQQSSIRLVIVMLPDKDLAQVMEMPKMVLPPAHLVNEAYAPKQNEEPLMKAAA